VHDNVHADGRFFDLREIGELSKKLLQTKKHMRSPHLYLLAKLALILPVSTSSIERVFSAIKIINANLRNRISNEFLNVLLLILRIIFFESVSNDDIMYCF